MLLPERRVTGATPQRQRKGIEVPLPYRNATLGKQRGQHLGADARQRQQDGRIPGLLRRRLLLRRRARVVRWSSAGELIHRPAELTARVVELAG